MNINIEKIFNAPIEKVWKAWTDAEEMKKWWGPKDYTAPFISIDFREGGKFLGCMRGNMGPGTPMTDNWSGGIYQEIIPMQKTVMTDYFTDKDGNKVNAKDLGFPGEWPDEMKVTVEFENLGEKTKINLFHEGHPDNFADMAKMGWEQSLDKLEASL